MLPELPGHALRRPAADHEVRSDGHASGGDFSRYRVRGMLKDEASGQELVSQTMRRPRTSWPTSRVARCSPRRPYLVTFSLVDARKQRGRSRAIGVPRVPGPASIRKSMNMSFDAKNGSSCADKPRFVLGVYDRLRLQRPGRVLGRTQVVADRRAPPERHDFNFYLNYWYGEAPANAMKAMMDNLQSTTSCTCRRGTVRQFPAGSAIPDQ